MNFLLNLAIIVLLGASIFGIIWSIKHLKACSREKNGKKNDKPLWIIVLIISSIVLLSIIALISFVIILITSLMVHGM